MVRMEPPCQDPPPSYPHAPVAPRTVPSILRAVIRSPMVGQHASGPACIHPFIFPAGLIAPTLTADGNPRLKSLCKDKESCAARSGLAYYSTGLRARWPLALDLLPTAPAHRTAGERRVSLRRWAWWMMRFAHFVHFASCSLHQLPHSLDVLPRTAPLTLSADRHSSI